MCNYFSFSKNLRFKITIALISEKFKMIAHSLVVVFNFRCHADLIHERRKLLGELSENEFTVSSGKVFRTSHEEHFSTSARLALLLTKLNQHIAQS